MRVTNNALTTNYSNNYNDLLSKYLESQNRILTQRKFNRASEDPDSAAKAGHIRNSLRNLDIYDNNMETAKDLFKSAESVLYNISDETYLNIKSKIISVQDSMDQSELNIIACELEQQAEHILQNMNSDFASRQMFGGTNGDQSPFTRHDKVEVVLNDGATITFNDNVVCYNDIPVNLDKKDIEKVTQGGTIRYYNVEGLLEKEQTFDNNPREADNSEFPGTKPIYVDIGIGIKYSDKGEVIPGSALDTSINGVEITGSGIDEDGDSLNFIQLLYEAAAELKSGNVESFSRYIDKLDAVNSKILDYITLLGVKQDSLERYLARNSVQRISLCEKQNAVEGVDLEKEITNMKSIEAAYNAALSMGSKVLAKSLFDFIG